MYLYLITHAHTVQNSAADARTWRLSSHGIEQSQALARLPMWDSVQRIVLSTEPKTLLTVEPVFARGNLPRVADVRFDELRRGGWVGDYGAQVRAAFAQPGESVGGWEPAADALARFVEGVAELCRAYRGEKLALVSHGLVLSLYRTHLLGKDRVEYDDWGALSFGAVALVNLINGELIFDFEAVVDGPARSY